MVKLSRIKIAKRLVLLVSCTIALITGAFFAIKQVENHGVNAAEDTSPSGAYTVDVSSGEEIPYGDETWFTHRFTVATTDGDVTGFCAVPSIINTPGNSVEAQLLENTQANQEIKLLIYAATANNSTATAFMNSLYGGWLNPDTANRRYAYVHATIGLIYANDLTGFSSQSTEPDQIRAIIPKLQTAITNNADIWKMAKDYKLYGTVGDDSSVQTVVWIEPPEPTEYSISTSAADASDGDNFIAEGGAAQIIDTVSYCGAAGETYTIQGVLMNQSTQQELKIGGSSVSASGTATLPNDQTCGTTTITFNISDTTGLGGTNIVVFENLMSGTEVLATHNDLNDDNQIVTVVSLETTAKDGADQDSYIEAAKSATIIDTIDYCLKANEEYTLSGILMDKSTGEPLAIDGTPVEPVTLSFTPEENCGTTTMTFELDASKLAGKDIVVFESAYLGNKLVASHEDIEDASQTITVVSLATTASGESAGSKEIVAAEKAVINDHVEYCLRAGVEYTILGSLVDKANGNPIKVNNEPVTQTATVTPSANNCGTIDMKFEFDATGLGGTDVVIFETALVESSSALGYEVVVSHEDLEDAAQTIKIVDPEKPDNPIEPKDPETGRFTNAVTPLGTTSGGIIPLAIGATVSIAVIYLGYRIIARRKVFGRR